MFRSPCLCPFPLGKNIDMCTEKCDRAEKNMFGSIVDLNLYCINMLVLFFNIPILYVH